MSLRDFQLSRQLGKGSFGSVFKATRKADGMVYALKRIDISRMRRKDIEDSVNEARLVRGHVAMI
jgi:NIMA (never in mitosis gene a)-related kinase